MLGCVLAGYLKTSQKDVFTKIVPLTVWDCASFVLLHAKQVLSLHNPPDSWLLHGPAGG